MNLLLNKYEVGSNIQQSPPYLKRRRFFLEDIGRCLWSWTRNFHTKSVAKKKNRNDCVVFCHQ